MIAKITFMLHVRAGSAAPVSVRHSEFVVILDFPRVRAGATIPVRVDANRPSRVAIDWDRFS